MVSKKKIRVAMIITFLVSFVIYLITLCPTVYVGDSGEFTTAAYTLGITHPPGYPLYVLFGKIFSILIPYGNIAYRINLMSGLFGALTCSILYLILIHLFRRNNRESNSTNKYIFIAILSSLFLSFSKTFWSQSVIAEVYTINAFIIALLIYLSVTKHNNIYIIAFVTGVGISGHYLTALLFPAFLLLFWKILLNEKNFIERTVSFSVFLLLGLSVLLFMPVRSSANPFMDWGDTETFQNFIAQIRRVQYKTFEFGQSVNFLTKLSFIKYFFKLAGEQFTYYMVPFILLGMLNLYKEFKKYFTFTVTLFVINSVVLLLILKFQFNPQQASVVEVYFLPAYTVMAIWLSFGFLYISKYIKYYFLTPLIILPILFNFNYNNKRNNFIASDYSSNILKSLPTDSHYFSSGDNQMFLLSYQQWCLKKRKDASFYTDTGLLFKNIFGSDFFRLTREEKIVRRAIIQRELLKGPRPVCFSLGSSLSNLKDVKSRTTGIIFNAKPSILDYNLWACYKIRDIDNKNYLEEYLLRDVSAQYHYFIAERHYEQKKIQDMFNEYNLAANVGGDVEWVHNNIGISLKEKGFQDESIKYFRKGIEINPYDENAKTNLAFMYLTKGYEYFKLKKYDEAIDLYNKSAAANPMLPDTHNYLGVLFEEQNNNELAIAEYRKAIDLKYNYIDAHYNLGVTYWKLQKWQNVIEQFEIVLQLDPNHEQARKYLTILKK